MTAHGSRARLAHAAGTGLQVLSMAAALFLLVFVHVDMFLMTEGGSGPIGSGIVAMLAGVAAGYVFPFSLGGLLIAHVLRGAHGPWGIAALATHAIFAYQAGVYVLVMLAMDSG